MFLNFFTIAIAILYSFDFFDLQEAREAFQTSVDGTSLDVNAPEVEACGKLLRRVYQLAMTDDKSLSGL